MFRLLPLAVALLAFAGPPAMRAAQAQTVIQVADASAPGAQAAIEERRQLLFQRMLRQPGDLDAAFEYAMLSIQVNDLEAAVSTLERMLIFSPGLARVQLELGVLYYRLGAYASARAYLEAAASGPDVPPDVHQAVRGYLEQMDLMADPPPFSGSVFSGIRWQSNANSGPGSRDVTLNGLTFVLDEETTGKEDWSVVNVATFRFVKNLRHRQGDRLEAETVAYSARFFEQDEVNIEFVETFAGPNFNMKRYGIDKTRLFVYGIGDLARLDDEHYFSSGGFGARFTSNAADRATLEVEAEQRFRHDNNTSERPSADLRNGGLTNVSATYSYRLKPNMVFSIQGQTQREDADAGFYANREFSLSGGFALLFASPFQSHPKLAEPWLLQLGLGGIRRRYDEPDPTIDATEREKDRVLWGRAAVVVPVGEHWALVPQVEYRDQWSNYDIRDFTNLTAMVGAQRRF